MSDQRELFRISVHRKGFLRRRGDTTVCEIYDLTEKGLQIATEIPLTVSETVALEFQLVDRVVIHCALLVAHAQDLKVGGRIIQISTEHQEALTRFLNQMITVNLVAMGSESE
jgi:hypothetical protein